MRPFRFLYIFLVLGGIIAGILLLKYNQDLRRLAKGPDRVGEIAFSSEKESSSDGIKRVDLLFRTGSPDDLEKISTVSFRFKIPIKENQKIELVDKNGEVSEVIFPDEGLLGSGEWKFPVNKIEKSGDGIIFDFSGVNLNFSGYESSDYKKLASIYLKIEGDDKNLSDLIMEKESSSMMTKTRPIGDILTVPETAKYEIEK